jgi:hypothetical protein
VSPGEVRREIARALRLLAAQLEAIPDDEPAPKPLRQRRPKRASVQVSESTAARAEAALRRRGHR